MDIQNILTLIQAVSDSSLTGFKLEEGNLKLSLSRQGSQMQFQETSGILSGNGNTAGSKNTVLSTDAGNYVSETKAETVSADEKKESGEAVDTVSAKSDIHSDKVVTSPLVGTFYTASSPDAESFVKVGDTVKKGQVLGIVEAMKLMNEIESDYDGVVEAILVGNEEVVEFGQPLFRIH